MKFISYIPVVCVAFGVCVVACTGQVTESGRADSEATDSAGKGGAPESNEPAGRDGNGTDQPDARTTGQGGGAGQTVMNAVDAGNSAGAPGIAPDAGAVTPWAGGVPPTGWTRGVVSIGYGGIRALSRDGGKTWTKTAEVKPHGGDDGDLLRSVAFGKGLWVAGGWDKWWTSKDGATWELRTHKFGIIQGLAFGNDMFMATTIDADVLVSDDGLAWRQLANAGTGGHTRLIFGNGLFAASGDSLFTNTSADGRTWKRLGLEGGSVAFCDGAFKTNQACFGHPYEQGFWIEGTWLRLREGNVQFSPDGKVWSKVYEPGTNPLETLFIGWVPPV